MKAGIPDLDTQEKVFITQRKDLPSSLLPSVKAWLLFVFIFLITGCNSEESREKERSRLEGEKM